MALCLHQQNCVQLFLSVAKKTLRGRLSKSGSNSLELLAACRPPVTCCALQGALFTLQGWFCTRPYGRRLEGIVVPGIFRRFFRWSEVSNCVAEVTFWRQVEKQIHEQWLSVLSAVGARMWDNACKSLCSIPWQVHVLPLTPLLSLSLDTQFQLLL